MNAFYAMDFARQVHAGHVRKYTGNPYSDHLAEVAGIVATVDGTDSTITAAWLHDYVEDINPTDGLRVVQHRFGPQVAEAVRLLSDLEVGNRANRARLYALRSARLASAPAWVQTIKCADLISNTSSIVLHDPKFAVTYLAEKRALLEVLTLAHPALRRIAMEQATC